MSKPSSSGLTPSRKKRPGPAAVRRDLDWRDAMNDRCRNLTTLAGLLIARAEPLDAELASGAGWLIEREVRQVQTLLAAFGKEAR